uniref:Uncharacterized protein n=1 Tax=Micrurus corallinus TaxID=54390 RepID=A0A2D4EL09_MICCO
MDSTWKSIYNDLAIMMQIVENQLKKLSEEKEKRGTLIKKMEYRNIPVRRILKKTPSTKDKKRGSVRTVKRKQSTKSKKKGGPWVNGENIEKEKKIMESRGEKLEGGRLGEEGDRKWLQGGQFLNINALVLFLAFKDNG